MRPFTAVFGMGTGVTFSPWSPEKFAPAEAGRGKKSIVSGNWNRDAAPGTRRFREVENGQASRRISTGKLNASPRLHSRPIEVVVFDPP